MFSQDDLTCVLRLDCRRQGSEQGDLLEACGVTQRRGWWLRPETVTVSTSRHGGDVNLLGLC